MDDQNVAVISTIYSVLNKFRAEGKYCDVNIDIGDETFTGHRLLLAAVSEYFDTIFSCPTYGGENKFLIDEERSVALRDIEPEALKKILQFVYTGQIDITDSNVLALLRTGDFLRLRIPFVEEKCLEYIRNMIRVTSVPIFNALDIFEFGCAKQKSVLIDLLSEHIYEHLNHFSKYDKFVEISFDNFNILLKHKNPTCVKDENVLLNSIILWAHHSFKERRHQVDELMENVDFTKISTPTLSTEKDYENTMVNEYCVDDYSCTLSHAPELALHVYVRYSTVPRRVGVLSNHKNMEDWILSFEFDSLAEKMRNVTIDDNLYCLGYEYKLSYGTQTFTVSNSISAYPTFHLKNPPLILRKFDLCGMDKGIYVYDQDIYEYSSSARRDESFSAEEISRGIFVYKCEMDKWFPLPAMKQRLYRSCIAISDHLLYVIGGDTYSGNPTSFAQFYDIRTRRWNKLPETLKKYEIEDCCAHRGRIYLAATDSKHVNVLDVFDPVAQRWRNELTLEQTGVQLVSYEDELWIMNRFNSNLNFSTFNDTAYPSMREIRSLSEAVAKVSDHAYCLDAVVF